jgi:hypothetical protein
MLTTPFSNNFKIDLFEISDEFINVGYINLSKIPDIETIIVTVQEYDDIVYDEYLIEKVTEDNSYLYSGVEIGYYVIIWLNNYSSSTVLELETILRNNIGNTLSIKYISTD